MRIAIAAAIAAAALHAAAQPPADPAALELFERHVRPVFAERCHGCHGPEKQKAGLRLDSAEAFLRGSDLGPVVDPAAPESSKLLIALDHAGTPKMPPEGRLPQEQIDGIAAWVRLGAPWPAQDAAPASPAARGLADWIRDARATHWAFRPVVPPAVPPLDGGPPARNEIDAIVQARLTQEGLKPAPEAARSALIRRAYYDVVGLPPGEEAVRAFAGDPNPNAYEALIDALLASPHFGERWARHWLDVARYADTKGYVFQEERTYPFPHTYRDFVIRAFNEDLPYDRFVRYQLAADRMELGGDPRPLAAMGFLTLGRRFINNIHDITDDRIDVVARGLLGLTVGCARCHDHKYDPVSQADYYALYGVFRSSEEPAELPLIETPSPDDAEYKAYEAAIAEAQTEIDRRIDEIHAALLTATREKTAGYLLAAHEARDADEAGVKIEAQEHGVLWQLVLAWREHLAARRAAHDPVLAPWFALCGLAPDRFAADAPALCNAIADGSLPGGPVNARVATAFKDFAPAALADAAARYGTVFAEAAAAWGASLASKAQSAAMQGQTALPLPEALPDAELEAVRQVLFAAGSPNAIARDAAYGLSDVPTQGRIREARNALARVEATHPGRPDRAQALQDAAAPFDPYVFKRGKPDQKGDPVPRRFLALLSDGEPAPFVHGSGRLELADAIASPANPLTARVFVNRVWMHLFGAPLVDTPSDFGLRSDAPVHGALLDWLAWRFMEDGWSVKTLMRRILLSHTYRQSSDAAETALAKDPENRLLWRQNRRRLDFEALRDTVLDAAGTLDRTLYGHSVNIEAEPFSGRRTVYAFIERQNLPGLFRIFDFAGPDTHSPRRLDTTVPQQALYFLNSPFAVEQARRLAARTADLGGDGRIAGLYALAYARAPADDEFALAHRFLDKAAGEPPPTRSPWQYGYGSFDPSTSTLASFTPLPDFREARYAGGPEVPAASLGWALLGPGGGHPGAPGIAVVRRWTAPVAGHAALSGMLRHEGAHGDGVIAAILSSRHGALWSGAAARSETAAEAGIAVEAGDTIDFVAACGADEGYDGFSWAPHIELRGNTGEAAPARAWDAAEDFAGPPPPALAPWEQYAQTLLMSNELAFID